MTYATPTTLADALELVSSTEVTALAGGTDFYPARVGHSRDESVLDLSRLAELRGVSVAGGHIRIGAMTTWSEIAREDLPGGCLALQQAAVDVGGPQVQNVATIGGNICNSSPAADGIPPLLIVDALVELASVSGTRTMPLQEFMLGYRRTALRSDELLTALLVPESSGDGRSALLKLGSRKYLVISIAVVAARIVVGDEDRIVEARVAVGACSPTAQRLVTLEQDLIGVGIADAPTVVGERHVAGLSPIDDLRASADYRLQAARVMVGRAVGRCLVPA